MPRLCDFCGGAVDQSVITQPHRSGFNVQFEILYELIYQVVADLWQRIGKIRCCFKNSISVALRQCQSKVRFLRKGSSIVIEFFLTLLKG